MYFPPPAVVADLYANRPAAGIAGRVFHCADSPIATWRDTGSAWEPYMPSGNDCFGSVKPTEVPSSLASFTLLKMGNQNTTPSIAVSKGVGTLIFPGDVSFNNGQFHRVYYTSSPGNTWIMRAILLFGAGSGNNGGQCGGGLIQQDSVNSRQQVFNLASPTSRTFSQVGLLNQSFSGGPPATAVTFNASLSANFSPAITGGGTRGPDGAPVYMQVEQTTTSWIYTWGHLGRTSSQTVTRSGSYLATGGGANGPDRLGFFCNPDECGGQLTVLAWSLA